LERCAVCGGELDSGMRCIACGQTTVKFKQKPLPKKEITESVKPLSFEEWWSQANVELINGKALAKIAWDASLMQVINGVKGGELID